LLCVYFANLYLLRELTVIFELREPVFAFQLYDVGF